jgi:hypothetical protein
MQTYNAWPTDKYTLIIMTALSRPLKHAVVQQLGGEGSPVSVAAVLFHQWKQLEAFLKEICFRSL